MITDTQRVRLYNKKILPYDQFKDMFLDSLLTNQATVHQDVFSVDGVFTSRVAMVAGGANNTLSIPAAFRGVTGNGKTVNIGAVDSRFQNVLVPASAATVFHVGIEQSEVEAEIETNPRTGEAEYRTFIELIGRKGTPTSVTDNGNGTITFNVNSVCESGFTYAGRQVRVWLKSRTDGGAGPLSPVEATAIETRTVAYGAPNNTITTAGNFGQTTVSTTPADYVIMMIGPTIKRTAAEDLRTTSGCLYMGAVVSVAAGNPLVSFDVSEQRVFEFTLAAMGDIFHTAIDEMTRSGVISGFGNGGTAALNLTVQSGVYWMAGHRVSHAGAVVACTNNVTGYVYVDTDGVIKYTASSGVALPRLLLYRVAAAAGSITSVLDMRRFWTRTQSSRGRITVGHINCDFTTLESAIAWTEANSGTGEDNPFEIMVHGDLTMTATINISSTVHITGVRRAHINTPSNAFAFTVTSSVNSVVFRDIQFDVPSSSGSALINMGGGGTCDHWEFHNCQFNGGRDGTPMFGLAIGVAVSTGSQSNWMFRGCQFLGTFNSATPYVAVDSSAKGWTFDKCRFVASTANTGSLGIQLMNGASNIKITNCYFEMGGTHIHLKDTNNTGGAGAAVVGTLIQGNTFLSSRISCILDETGAPVQILNNRFSACNSVGTGSDAVVEVATAANAKAWICGNDFDEWGTDAAIRISAGNGHVIAKNRLATAAAAVVVGIQITHAAQFCLISGNYIDIDRGNVTGGTGKAAGEAISAPNLNDSVICDNVTLNCGTSGSNTTGDIAFSQWCQVSNNVSRYGAGPQINQLGTDNVIYANTSDQDAAGRFRVTGNIHATGDVFHDTYHERSIHASKWDFDNSNTAFTLQQAGYRSAINAIAILYVALDFLEVGDHITYAEVFYNPNGGGNMQPKLRRQQLSTGTISDVWAGVTDNTGTAIESQNSGAIDHTVAAGYAYFLENLHSGAANRTHGATVRYTRPPA